MRVVVDSVRRDGIRETYRRIIRAVRSRKTVRRQREADRAFDADRRVDTADWVLAPDLVTASSNRGFAVRYEPSNVEDFERLMAKLDVDHSEFVFVDYGSGKGKVLLLAAAYPFKRIVGVEFSPPLVQVARENIAQLGSDAARVELVLKDATEFEPPPEPLVLYFFNPFGLAVLLPVLARVRASLDLHARPAYIVVTGPPEVAEAIEEAGFAPVAVERLGWWTRGVFAR